MAEFEDKNEMMIQLPWAVPQQPLVMTQIQVDPDTKKIPLDLNVSSTDWVLALSVIVSAIISFIGFFITIYVVKHSTKTHIESNKQLIDSHEKQKIMELEIIYHKKWFDEVVDCVAELNSKLAEWAPNTLAVNLHLIKEKELDDGFQIFQNEYYIERIKQLELEKTEISKYINKILILLKLRGLMIDSLEKELLDIHILMNKQTTSMYNFQDFGEGNKEIYLKNIRVGEELRIILSNELTQIKKAA